MCDGLASLGISFKLSLRRSIFRSGGVSARGVRSSDRSPSPEDEATSSPLSPPMTGGESNPSLTDDIGKSTGLVTGVLLIDKFRLPFLLCGFLMTCPPKLTTHTLVFSGSWNSLGTPAVSRILRRASSEYTSGHGCRTNRGASFICLDKGLFVPPSGKGMDGYRGSS